MTRQRAPPQCSLATNELRGRVKSICENFVRTLQRWVSIRPSMLRLRLQLRLSPHRQLAGPHPLPNQHLLLAAVALGLPRRLLDLPRLHSSTQIFPDGQPKARPDHQRKPPQSRLSPCHLRLRPSVESRGRLLRVCSPVPAWIVSIGRLQLLTLRPYRPGHSPAKLVAGVRLLPIG